MFEYVKSAGLVPIRPLTKRSKTDLVLLHMSGSDVDTVQSMDKYHKGKGHKMIDYNFVVDADGSVWKGRGLEYEGGSVNNNYIYTKGMNARAVAICCVGDFNRHGTPQSQLNALKRLVAGSNYTDCPGAHFPTLEIHTYIRNGGNEIAPVGQQPEAYPPEYEVTVSVLNFREEPEGRVLRQLKRGDRRGMCRARIGRG